MVIALPSDPVQFDSLLLRLLRSLHRLELRLIVRIRWVLLPNELRDQLLNLVVIIQILPDLVDKVFVDEAVEGV